MQKVLVSADATSPQIWRGHLSNRCIVEVGQAGVTYTLLPFDPPVKSAMLPEDMAAPTTGVQPLLDQIIASRHPADGFMGVMNLEYRLDPEGNERQQAIQEAVASLAQSDGLWQTLSQMSNIGGERGAVLLAERAPATFPKEAKFKSVRIESNALPLALASPGMILFFLPDGIYAEVTPPGSTKPDDAKLYFLGYHGLSISRNEMTYMAQSQGIVLTSASGYLLTIQISSPLAADEFCRHISRVTGMVLASE